VETLLGEGEERVGIGPVRRTAERGLNGRAGVHIIGDV
jgi:hypothetical protein